MQKGAEIALSAEQQHIDEPRDHRRDREGKVDQGVEDALARELEFGDGPGGGQAEHHIGGNGDGRDEQGEPDGSEGVGLGDGGEISADAGAERFDEHRSQRHKQEQHEKSDRDSDQEDADGPLLGGDRRAALLGDEQRGDGGIGHRPNLRRCQACTRCTKRRMPKEIISIAVPMAAACA